MRAANLGGAGAREEFRADGAAISAFNHPCFDDHDRLTGVWTEALPFFSCFHRSVPPL